MPPKKIIYTKKDQISHVIDRSDMYVGSRRLRDIDEYIASIKIGKVGETNSFEIIRKTIKSSPGLLRIFVEPLSNAIDNVERSRQRKIRCSKIEISLDSKTGETSIWNDGYAVAIEMHEEEGCYNHSLIFGQLNTSSNYDDEEERTYSGRNGLGVKLTNIFSKSFKVEGCDPDNRKSFSQLWTNNMKEASEPVIKNVAVKNKGYTKVTWTPDFKLFGMKNYSVDIINLYVRYILDAAMLSKINVYFNGTLLDVSTLQNYSKLYKCPTDESLLIKTKTSEVLITPSTEFQAISFVNGVYTSLGGKHVESWCEAIFRPIINKFNKTKVTKTVAKKPAKKPVKKIQITIKDVKQFFRVFIISTVINPEFDGQDKNKLESPEVKAEFLAKHMTAISKWSVMGDIDDLIKGKEMMSLKKTERKRYSKVAGLDPANNSGSKDSPDCTLILCEGLSAKTYAVAGIEQGVYGKSGRDWFGIYPLRGKVLNVRNSTAVTIAANAVICDLVKAIGVRHGVDYRLEKNFITLMYGKIMIMTDADVDGIHIEGLLMNFFHSLFPTLLERSKPYIVSMKTPIVRVFKLKGPDLLFYDERRFRAWSEKQIKKQKIKYYKGLGTTKASDVPDTFGLKMVEYTNDDSVTQNMNKVFNKKCADARKTWLSDFDMSNSISLDDVGEIYKMQISDFIDGEMIKFSHADCKRSIPNGIDGLKESQRKILFAVKKRKLRYSGPSLKVAQLGAYVAEHTDYEHGENNLFDTIIKMANEFPGSNNIPLLYRDGMFGTRLSGGKDSASPRYIFTRMEALTHLIFREEDDVLLDYIVDSGNTIEPKFYVPIIPMILVNGCSAGIGTGWSCNVPCYNPIDMIDSIKVWLENDGEVLIEDVDDGTTISMFPDLVPWYRFFTGTIKPVNSGKFITRGKCERVQGKKDTCLVSELPIGLWTDKFKETCESHIESKSIKHIKNYSTPVSVNFLIKESPDGLLCSIETLKLSTNLHTTNIVLFDEKNQIGKMNNVDEVLDKFCIVRFDYYIKRKKNMIKTLENELSHLGNKERFILEVINEELIIMNENEQDILEELELRGYDKYKDKNKNKNNEDEDEDEGEENKNEGSYNYLLRLQVRTFTANKVKQIKKDIESSKKKLDNIVSTSEKQMWLNDLSEFETEYRKWEKIMEKERLKTMRKKKKK